MDGYMGKILCVDLTAGELRNEPVNGEYVRDYVGGSGLAVRYLWDLVGPDTDPLGPDNPLLFFTGPLTGTGGPSVGRFTVCARSPRTGLWGESNCGGFWGPELRFAGYDGLLITGQASKPVYLWVQDGRVELRDASHLWGQTDTYATQTAIREELGQPRAQVMAIGSAGERMIPLANIITGHGRAAGRTGMGAVMGSKNLKAIAVRGTGKLPLADPVRYRELRRRINRELKEHPRSIGQRMAGSAAGAEFFDMFGSLTARYFTRGQFPAVGQVSGAAMAETILTGISACHGCVIACGRRVAVTEGPYAGSEIDGPEYETICGFGPQLLIDDLAAITHLGHLCDCYGLDTISTSGTIAFAFYLFDQGIVGPQDTGGLKLAWGDAEAAARLIELLVQQDGFGALLAQGSLALGRYFGVEELAVQVNGQEVAYHDPRAFSSMALVYATSPRGACHNQSDYYMVEFGQTDDELGIPLLDKRQEEGKAAHVAVHQDWRSVCNSLVLCIFAAVPVSDVVALFNAATGREWDIAETLRAGRRIWNLKRAFNCRLGLTRANERLPRLLLQPLADGPTEGYVPDLDVMLREYYAVRGWDPETGKPTRETLAGLGLGFAAGEFT
jgi:aldehyde:ferredoxin oxidoreductase